MEAKMAIKMHCNNIVTYISLLRNNKFSPLSCNNSKTKHYEQLPNFSRIR